MKMSFCISGRPLSAFAIPTNASHFCEIRERRSYESALNRDRLEMPPLQ